MSNKEAIYGLWQQGKKYQDIADELFLDYDYVKKTVNESPRERICGTCGGKFKAFRGQLLCSTKCRLANTKDYRHKYYQKNKEVIESTIESLESVNARARAQGKSYGQLQAEVFFGTGGGKRNAKL